MNVVNIILLVLDMCHETKKGLYGKIVWLLNLFPVLIFGITFFILEERTRFTTKICFCTYKAMIFHNSDYKDLFYSIWGTEL